MDKTTYECSLDLAQDVIFGSGGKDSDALVLLNWLDSHKPCHPIEDVIGMQKMFFCMTCEAPVYKGDHFCSKCGRGLEW